MAVLSLAHLSAPRATRRVEEQPALDQGKLQPLAPALLLLHVVTYMYLVRSSLSPCLPSPFSSSPSSPLLPSLLLFPPSPFPSFVPEHDFLSQLDDDPGFTNPQAVANLRDLLGLSSSGLRPTLIRDLQLLVSSSCTVSTCTACQPWLGPCRANYPESDYAEPLRKAQRFKWSMKTWAIFQFCSPRLPYP